ncbi:MAG: VTT domain-containing protein [Candidatus Korobacteraceae bacterium]|jgi:membrane protein YqaA with SNARE-associated domain
MATFLQPAARRQTNYMSVLRHLGVLGLFLLAIADSTPLPTFAGPDILTAILAARHRDPWYYYAAVTTAGSVIGAYITFRMAHRAGASYLRDKFGERKVNKLLAYFERWGTGVLVLSSAVPFPSPTSAFFAAAGVLNYPARKFVVVVALSRAARYAAIASIASHYGGHFIRALRHPAQYYGLLLVVTGAVFVLVLAAILLHRQLEDARGVLRNQI